jgi:Flp pilus assembly protein protease CpaA
MILFFFVLTFLLLAVIYYDMTRFTIPNWIWQAVVALFVVAVLVQPQWRNTLSVAEWVLLGLTGGLSLMPVAARHCTEETLEKAFEWAAYAVLLVLGAGLYHAFGWAGSDMLSSWFPQDYAFFGAPQEGMVFTSYVCLLIFLLIGMLTFLMGWFGGGDVKLLAALALWTSADCSLELLIWMGLLGGFLVFPLLMVRDLFDPKELSVLEWKGSRVAGIIMTPYLGIVNFFRMTWRVATSPVRPMLQRIWPEDKLPAFLQGGQPLAYGIPISIVFLVLMFMGKVPYLPLELL